MKIYNGVLEKVSNEDVGTNGVFSVPNEVFKIGNYAFKNCINLSEINFPNTITYIGINAFEGTGIQEVCLPAGLSSIEPCTFENCKELECVFIPDNVTIIKDATFYKCSKLRNIHIGKNMVEVGNWAFCECENLGQLTLPDNVKRIGFAAFKDCKSLANISLGNGLKFLGKYSFNNCEKLAEIILPDSLEIVSPEAFENCKNLKAIHIGLHSNIKDVGCINKAIKGCDKYEGVVVLENAFCRNNQ